MNFQQKIFSLLEAHVASRPGLDPMDYASYSDYRSEQRSIARDRNDFNALMTQCAWREFEESEIRDAFRAFSGRLSIETKENGKIRLSYCTGQYYPTEYRKAACAVLASLLWNRIRSGYPHYSGHDLRKHFVREFGRGVAGRWFN